MYQTPCEFKLAVTGLQVIFGFVLCWFWVAVQPCYSDSEYKLESALCLFTTRNSLLPVQIDGIELMTELLQNEGWSHIPIIGKQIMPTH